MSNDLTSRSLDSPKHPLYVPANRTPVRWQPNQLRDGSR